VKTLFVRLQTHHLRRSEMDVGILNTDFYEIIHLPEQNVLNWQLPQIDTFVGILLYKYIIA